MAFVNLVGAGLWMPPLPAGTHSTQVIALQDSALLDANDEEYQMIGPVYIVGGGTKTFGGGSSTLGWLPGASITFLVNSTLRVGAKDATKVDAANGPPARATLGTAAFNVYKDLVGGTDTIATTTWRADAMASGTPFSVAHGDMIALCFQLTTTAGTPSVKVRQSAVQTGALFPAFTLVTSGPTYAGLAQIANVILTFSDGTLGWITPTLAMSAPSVTTGTIGDTNIKGNIFRLPFTAKVDALAVNANPSTNAANFALDLYSTPLGTPVLMASVAFDGNITRAVGASLLTVGQLSAPQTLTANTDYAVGLRQTTATQVSGLQVDVDNVAHWATHGMGPECYGADSTAGATFAAVNSGKRRYQVYVRLSTLDDGSGLSLSAADIRGALGLASANLDTQLTTLQADTDNLQTRLPAALVSGRMDASVGAMAADVLTAAALAADAVTEIQTGIGGGGGLDAAAVRAAVGLASANLDTQLGAIDDFLDTEVLAIKAKTDALPTDPADASDIAASFASVAATLATIAGYLDTEVAAIKAKTDLIPASPAAVGSAMTLSTDAITAAVVALSACQKLADVLLRRHTTSIEASANGEALHINSLYGALALGTGHKRDTTTNPNMLTVYQADDTTELAQVPITTDALAEPIVSAGG